MHGTFYLFGSYLSLLYFDILHFQSGQAGLGTLESGRGWRLEVYVGGLDGILILENMGGRWF